MPILLKVYLNAALIHYKEDEIVDVYNVRPSYTENQKGALFSYNLHGYTGSQIMLMCQAWHFEMAIHEELILTMIAR